MKAGCALFVILLFGLSGVRAPVAFAQSDVPVLSGGVGFLGATQGNVTFFQPVITPVLAFPLSDKWLIESRADLRGFISREDGSTGPYQGQFFDTLEYLQLDYLMNSHVTITAGRFLTPFGTYLERFSPIWISKLQDAPLIAAIGTNQGYSDGFMLRGQALSSSKYVVNYTAYFSTLSTVTKFESERSSGGRVGLFLPSERLEIGTSYDRTLRGRQSNSVGLDLSWEPYALPLDVKGEWAHSRGGHGYWIQGAYRLSQFSGAESPIGRLEPVFRFQQFFRSTPAPGDSLPSSNTFRPEFGLNYYLPHTIRLNASYARESFAQKTDIDVWEFGITYRFLFPTWPGASK
jgi:hypothetical protein